ncbi:MAG TPA: 2-C-methyl-D-erythritol 4-phosphate cytidylyltransferase [Candidatus Limnocylindrales bacterium]|nr:2-C-methyl-D-erythritol 4-phosphate cytidylyltransferase [Candidatus Limnocylindrales bacterium]
MRVGLLVPAAGSGERLGLGTPKALVELDGQPLVRRTLERLAQATTFNETVVLAPAAWLPQMEQALAGLATALGQLQVCAGGATRQASVRAGLTALSPACDLVCVHDAARPLVDAATVRGVLEQARAHGAATAASRPADSIRVEDGGDAASGAISGSGDRSGTLSPSRTPAAGDGGGHAAVTRAVDRARVWLVETPQAFRRELLERAHARALRDGTEGTDDASLVEALGVQIRVVGSGSCNLKITSAADLLVARALLGL